MEWYGWSPTGLRNLSPDLHVNQPLSGVGAARRVFVFVESSVGFPISAGIPNTTLMSAHLLIAAAYLCRFN